MFRDDSIPMREKESRDKGIHGLWSVDLELFHSPDSHFFNYFHLFILVTGR